MIYKEKIVQLVSFSSIYNDNLQCELKKIERFAKSFDIEIINIENELAEFENENGINSIKSLNIFKKIFYCIQFNSFLIKKYLYFNKCIVNIQYVSAIFIFLLPFIKHISNKIIVSFWGSDLLRANIFKYYIIKKISDLADIITFETNDFSKIFVQKIGKKYSKKIRYVKFGVSLFNEIDSITQDEILAFKDRFHIDIDRYVVVIGNNKNYEQQHILAIKSIISSNIDRKKIFIILPWTYGHNDIRYKLNIVNILNNKYDFAFIDDRLTNKETATLRCITDIMINVQTTDVMSSTMLEALYAEKQLIVGGWLPYDSIYDAGVYMHQVDTISMVGSKLKSILDVDRKNEVFAKNKEIIYKLYSWKNCIEDWIKLY